MTTERTIPDPGLTEGEVERALDRIGLDDEHPDLKVLVKKLKAALATLPPVMEETTYPGAVVMTDDGPFIRSFNDEIPWFFEDEFEILWMRWRELRNPRPLTPAERREHGIPRVLGDDEVAVKRIDDVCAADARDLASWLERNDRNSSQELWQNYANSLEAEEADQ